MFEKQTILSLLQTRLSSLRRARIFLCLLSLIVAVSVELGDARAEEALLVRDDRILVRVALDGSAAKSIGVLPASVVSPKREILFEVYEGGRYIAVYRSGKGAAAMNSVVVASVDPESSTVSAPAKVAEFSSTPAITDFAVTDNGAVLFVVTGALIKSINLDTGSISEAGTCAGTVAILAESSGAFSGCFVPGAVTSTFTVRDLTGQRSDVAFSLPAVESGIDARIVRPGGGSRALFGVMYYRIGYSSALFGLGKTEYGALIDADAGTSVVLMDFRNTAAEQIPEPYHGMVQPLYLEPGTTSLYSDVVNFTGAKGGFFILNGVSLLPLDGGPASKAPGAGLPADFYDYLQSSRTQNLLPVESRKVATSTMTRDGFSRVEIRNLSNQEAITVHKGVLLGVLPDCSGTCSRAGEFTLTERPARPVIGGVVGHGASKLDREVAFLSYPDFSIAGSNYRFKVNISVDGEQSVRVQKANTILVRSKVKQVRVRYKILRLDTNESSPWSPVLNYKFPK